MKPPFHKLDEKTVIERSYLAGGLTRLKTQMSQKVDEAVSHLASFIAKGQTDLSNQLTIGSEKLIKEVQKGFGSVLTVKVENFPADKEDLTPQAVHDSSQEIVKALEEVKNSVESITIPESEKIDFKPVLVGLEKLQKQIKDIKIPEPKEIVLPKPEKVVIPSRFSLEEGQQILQALSDVKKAIGAIQISYPDIKLPKQVDLTELTGLLEQIREAITNQKLPEAQKLPDVVSVHIASTDIPQKVPQPVTNININALRGIVHSTATTVTTALTPLPGYGVLSNRRSIILFNNSSSVTVYVGGSDVTSGNGLPVLPQSYSPAIDSGPLQRWYGVTSTSSADVRVIEVANDSGN